MEENGIASATTYNKTTDKDNKEGENHDYLKAPRFLLPIKLLTILTMRLLSDDCDQNLNYATDDMGVSCDRKVHVPTRK